MGDELSGLLEIFKKVKEAGGQATLTATTKEGKTKFNLEIVSPPATAPPPLQPVPGHARRRHRGAAARARRRQRAADHQGTTLAAPAPVSQPPAPPAPGEVSAPAGPHHDHLPQRRPLFPIFLPSPSPSTGRRRVMSLARLPLPSFASLNIDGHPPSPPPSAAAVRAASYVGKKCCGTALVAESLPSASSMISEERRLSMTTRQCCSCSVSSLSTRQHVCSSSGSSVRVLQGLGERLR